MENTVTSSKARAFAALAFIIALTASTCKAPFGLGGQVDTAIPVVTIDSPSRNAYVKGSMTISGKSTDDLAVASVTITVLATDGTLIGSYPATLAGDTYAVTIPTAGAGLEGEVIIEATAVDENLKQTATRTSVFIDNIAPTVLVTSPLTMDPDSPIQSDYIDIKGEVFDRSPVDSVYVSLIRDDGSVIAGPKLAEGTNTWTARFLLKGTIAGLTDGQYFYTVTVSDFAGNSSSYYFHRTDIIAIKSALASFPSMDEIGKIDQDGIAGSSGITVAELEGKRLDSIAEYGDFEYVSAPLIDFSYSNLTEGVASADENLLAPNSKITGAIIPPTGTGAIDKATVSAVIRDEDDAPIFTITNATDDETDNIKVTTVGDAVNFAITLKNGAAALLPAKYSIVLSAETDQGVMGQENAVPFTIDAEAPTFSETSLQPTDLFKRAAFKFSFDGSHNTTLDKIVIEQSFNGAAYAIAQTIQPLAATSFSGQLSGFMPTGSDGDGLYNFRITLSTVGGKSTALLRSITYDSTPPNLDITTVSPVVGTNSLNGTVNLGISAADANGIAAVRRWVLADTAAAPAWGDTGFTGYGEWTTPPYSYSLDTTTGVPSGQVKIWIRARDKAGNESATSGDYVIDQDSDKPVLSNTNMNLSYDTPAEATGNLQESGAKITGTITDDDGVDGASIMISINGAAAVPVGSKTAQGTGFNFQHDLSALSEGAHHIVLNYSDVAGLSGDAKTIYFVVDKTVPTVTVTAPASGAYRNGDFTVTGTASDGTAFHATTPVSATVKKDSDPASAATLGGTTANWTIPANGLDSGSYLFTITAMDQFGKTGTATVTVVVDKILPVVSISTPGDGAWNRGATMSTTGTVTEAGGIVSVQYSTNSTDGSDGVWNPASGTSSWSATVPISTLDEGSGKRLYVRATDMAGNIGNSVRLFGIDQNDPATTVAGPSSAAAAFGMTGTASDTNGVKSIVVSQILDGEEASRVTVLDSALAGPSDSWDTGATLPAGGVNTGTYDYTITVTDDANHSKVYYRTVTIDLAPPESVIINPIATDILFGDSYTARGTASDTGPSLLDRVEYSTDSTDGTDGSWTDAVGTSPWSIGFDLTVLGEGTKTLWTRAVDNAGNVQVTPSSITFMVDQYNPTLTETASTLDGTLVYKAADVNFGGASTDANGIASVVVTYEKGGVTTTALDQTTGADTWAWTLDTALGDGLYAVSIVATDNADRTTTIARRIYIDTTGPTLAVTAPLAGQAVTTQAFTISGTSYDTGGSGFDGTADVEYTLSDWSTPTSLALGAGAWSTGVDLGAAQGSRTLLVRSTDRLGNDTEVSTSFYYDSALPLIGETLVGTEDAQYANDDLGFSVTASDTWMLHATEAVQLKVNGAHAAYLTGAAGIYAYTFPVDTDGAGVVDTTGYLDGTYTLTFTAKDAANRTSSLTRTVVVDTTVPTLSGITDLSSGWLDTPSNTVSGTAGDGAGSGILTVEYDVNDSDVWKPLAGTGSFSGVVTIPSGIDNKLEIRATDKAGNVSAIATQFVDVDTINPSASLLTPATIPYASGLADLAVTFNGIDAQSGVAMIELEVGSNDFTTPDASETDVSAGNRANGTWALSVPAASILAMSEGQREVYVRVSDAAGNSSIISFPILVDKTDPGATISLPAAPSTVNKLISISGTASDSQSLKSVVVSVQTGAAAWTALQTFTGSSSYNWSVSGVDTETYDGYDSDAGTAGIQMTIRAIAEDTAGRFSAPATRTVTVDQNSDRPVIKISNLSVPSQVSLTAAAATNLITSASVHGLKKDDPVGFLGTGLAGGLSSITTYYVLESGLTTTQFRVATAKGGTELDISSAGTDMQLSYGGSYPSTLRMSRTVFGTVSDDDGAVSSISVSENDVDFTELPLDGGTWSYDASSVDGLKSLYFIVVDAAGAPLTFRTDAANEPRIQFAAGYHESFIQFRIDTVPPEFAATDPIQVDRTSAFDFSDAVSMGTGAAFGGPNDQFTIRILASDANGIGANGVKVYVPGAPGSPFTATANGPDPVQTAFTRFDTGIIDIGSVPDGSVSINIEVTDNSGLTSATSRTIIVDNTLPTLGFIAPSTGALVKADTTISGNASDGGSGLDAISYRVGLDYAADAPLTPGGEAYLWDIAFDLEDTGYQDGSESYLDMSTGTAIYILPFVIKVTDKAGNTRETAPMTGTADSRPSDTTLVDASLVGNPLVKVGQVLMIGSTAKVITAVTPATGAVTWAGAVSTAETAFEIFEYALRVNPDGDKPTASISYPLNGTTLGGNIRLYGTAEDNQAVAEAWMQIDTNSDGLFTAADDAIGGWYNGDLGKKIDGASSWSYTINTTREFDPLVPGTTKKLDIRVQARDINGKIGPWSLPITIYVDAQVPQIGSSASLVLDPDATPGNGNEIPYTYGMYIKGTWYLRGSIEDEGAIDEITISGPVSRSIVWNGVNAYSGDTGSFTLVTVSDTAAPMYKRIDLNIPIVCPADTSAAWNLNLSAFDNSDPSKETFQALRFNIDTKAPTAGLASPTIDSTLVQQSDGWYKIKGTAVDDGSDIARVEVFFLRQGTSDPLDRIYNPLKASANMSYLGDITINADGSPTLSGDAAGRTLTSLTDASLVNHPMINVGQKLLVGTELRTVATYNAGAGTLAWLDGDVATSVTAYTLRLAIQIDNKNVTERWLEGALDSDDGDGYLEYLKQSLGTTYSWFVDINSMNIPDGPIEIHYIAYDYSGNAVHGQTPLSSGAGHYTVQNNGPRIAAIQLGSDLNADGDTDDAGETGQFNYASATAETETIEASFIVKDGPMTLLPIVTNGNGDLRIWMSGAYTLADFAFRTAGTATPVSIDDAALLAMGDGSRTFTIVVWDSTEELTPGTDSLSLTRGVTATVDVVDGNAPYAAIRPLYWNGASDNSLYLNSASNGHVDISSNATNGPDDPDVSGKVSVRGVAFDDQRIDAIYLYIGNGTDDTDRFAFPGAATKVIGGLTYSRMASYSAGSWSFTNNFAANGWQFAVTQNAFSQEGHRVSWRLDWDSAGLPGGAALDREIKIIAEDKASSPNADAMTSSLISGTGARPNEITLVDSSLTGSGAEPGLAILLKTGGSQEAYFTRIYAYDDATGTITLADGIDETKTEYSIIQDVHNDPSRAVDIVPYITDISRGAPFIDRLSHLAAKEGWYPVYQGQTGIVISGFNLPYASATTVTGNGTVAVGGTTFGTAAPDVTAALSDRTSVTVTIPAALLSGPVVVTTNTVSSINNLNSGTPEYNDEGAFTDDRILYIDDVAPTLYIAPFGTRYTSSTTDPGKVLDTVDAYEENIVMVDGPDTDPDLDTRAGHVEYSQFSNFSAIGVTITTATDVFAAAAHGLSIGQMVSLRWIATAPQLAPAVDVAATDMFYVISDGFGADAFKLAATPGGTAVDFTGAGATVTVVDPDVSGQVIFRGKAYDDQRIERISMTIAGFDGGGGVGLPFDVYTSTTNAAGVTTGTPLSGSGWDFDIDGSDQVIDSTRITAGHVLNWALSWDSSAIATTAAANVSVTMTVYDYNDTAHTASMLQSVDVVPYITGVAATASQTTGLSADVIRGATGSYSVEQHATNTMTISGFNLGSATYLPSARVSPAPILTPSGTSPVTAFVSGVETRISKTAANLGRSGYLTLFVNAVPSVNNLNDDTNAYNTEYVSSNPRSYKWTDTRYLWVWANTQLNDAVFNNQTYYYPDMMMSPTVAGQPIFSYSNDNNGYTYRTGSDITTTIKAGLYYERQTSLGYADGVYWILSVEDAFAGASIGFLQLNRDVSNDASIGAAGTQFIEIIGEDYQSRQLNRFRYPKLIAETSGTDANIYITYYDDEASQKNLTFVSFLATAQNAATGFTQATGDATRATQVMVIPNTASASSQYYAMAKVGTTGGIAVAYYDETNSVLKLAWSANAYGANNLTNTGATWATTTIDSNLFAGSHVSMVSDGSNLYVAYYDSGDANLKYARIAWNGSATAPALDGIVFVDKYLSVGSWTNIELVDKDGAGTAYTPQPYITYYSDSYNGTKKPMRMAFPRYDATSGALLHGVTGTNGENETYSGNWEIMTVPTLTTPKGGMEQFNHTQIGQYLTNAYNMPIAGWLGDKLEYAKLMPDN